MTKKYLPNTTTSLKGWFEHFRFPEVSFDRQGRFLQLLRFDQNYRRDVKQSTDCKEVTYSNIGLAAWQRGIKTDMRFCRKIFASHLRQSGIESDIGDLLQGRVPKSVFARHYITPSLEYRTRVLQALNSLRVYRALRS
jgi:intergrase/recombinase